MKKQLYHLDGRKLIPLVSKAKFWDIMVCIVIGYWIASVTIGEPEGLLYWICVCSAIVIAHFYSIRWAQYWMSKNIIIEEVDDTAQICPGSKRNCKDREL